MIKQMHIRSGIHPRESLAPQLSVSLWVLHDEWRLKHSFFHIISVFSNGESKKEKENMEKHSVPALCFHGQTYCLE